MDLYKFIYILSNIFLANIINKFMYLFYEKCRVNKYIEFCIYSAYFILITFVFLHFGKPIVTIGFNILIIFMITLMYDYTNLKKNILITFIIYLILFTIEVSIITLIYFSQKFNVYVSDEYKNMLVVVIDSIIYIVISFLIYIKKFRFKEIDLIFIDKFFIFFTTIPIISICLILINFLFNNNIMYIIILNLSILFSNIFIFKYCDLILKNIYKKIFDRMLNDRINSYKKEVQIFQNKIDFKNYINSNNYLINVILNSKISDIDDEVKLTFDVSIGENLKINLNDLLVIVGNIIDNAISGVKSTLENNDKYIDIKIKYIKGTVIFNVKNSFDEDTLNKNNKLFNKKGKFNNYGLGLLSVKEIVNKYKGVLEIKFNKNNFETYIFIYDMKV